MKNDFSVTDGTIILKSFKLEDAESHLAGEDDEIRRWLSGGASTLDSVQSWIKGNMERFERGGPVMTFAIWASGHLVGMIEINTLPEQIEGLDPGEANIAYAIYPNYRGKGYATAAVKLAMALLMKIGTIKHAVLRIDVQNASSLKLPSACGFEKAQEIQTTEGRMIKFIKKL